MTETIRQQKGLKERDMDKTTIYFELEEETLEKLKKFARDKNKTIDEVVEDALRGLLEEKED